MRESVLDDAVFACYDCGKHCNGHEVELSETKLVRCIDCLRAKQWSDSLRGMV